MRTPTPAKPIAILVGLLCLLFTAFNCRSKSKEPPHSPPALSPTASNTPPVPDAGPPLPPGSPVAYSIGAMAKIRPETPLPFAPAASTAISLTGARNEFLSFQIVINGGNNGAHDTSVSFDREFKGPGSIGGTDVTLYREDLINLAKPSYYYADGGTSTTGKWPDPLMPDVDEIAHEKRNAFPFKVNPNESRAIWVDIHVPADSPPGTYSGSFRVTVTSDGFAPTPTVFQFAIPVTLTVVDLTLPSTPSLTTAFLFWVPKLCEAHNVPCDPLSGDAKSIIQGYLRMGLEHRISLSTMFRVYSTPEEWNAFDAAYGPFIEGTADTRLHGAKLTSIQYTGPREANAYASFARHYKARGWFDRAYDFSADEPPRTIDFAGAMAQAALARQATVLQPDHSDPPIRTLMTLTLPDANKANVTSSIDMLGSLFNVIDTPQHAYSTDRPAYDAFARQPRHSFWLYQSCSSHGCAPGDVVPENAPDAGWPSVMIDASAAKNRGQEWLCFRMGADGEAYYESAMALSTAWTDQYVYDGNGEGTLFYPGIPALIGGTTAVPIASIRLKVIRMGVQDYEWLKQVAARGQADCAQAAAQLVASSSYQVSDNGDVYEAARQKLLSCLATGTGAP